MKKLMKFVAMVMVLGLTLSAFAGCSNKEEPSNAIKEEVKETAKEVVEEVVEEKDSYKFGVSYFDFTNPHFIEWSVGLNSVIVEGKGDVLLELDAQGDSSKQMNDVSDLIQQKVDAIFIAPVDSIAIKPTLLEAEKAGIPVIIMDVPVPYVDSVTASVTTDNYMAGKVLGEAMVEMTGGKANVALIDWSINSAVTARTSGFEDAIKDYPDIKIVARQDAGMPSVEDGLPIMEDFLQSNPEIDAVFGINDPLCQGAYNAITAAKKEGVGIYSIDGSKLGLEFTKEGKFIGTSAQLPKLMGETAGALIYDFFDGKTFDKDIKVDSVFVDKDLVDDFLK